jgi:OOP family OmpA-OmpF porin
VRSADGAPVVGAVVAIGRHPHANAVTDADGAFTTVELEPGPVDLQVSAPGFESALVQVGVTTGRAEPLTVTLVARPASANVHGRVLGRDGKGISATVKVAGQGKTAGIFEARSDAAGSYALTLPVGSYRARVEAPGLPPQETPFELAANQDKTVDFVWRAAGNPSVSLADGVIRVGQPIRFVGASAKLAPDSQRTLDAVAEVLNAHPEIGQVEIAAHWDASLGVEPARALTQQQAEAVRGYLLARGIPGDRLVATGAGNTRPLVPGDSPPIRQKNRRVELHVK